MKNTRYGTDADMNLKLVIGVARSANNIRRTESDVLREAGLTYPQFGVLEVLYHKGDLRVYEIIEKTLSTGGNMTVVIQNLIKEGLITRYKDPEDMRGFIVQLTEAGLQLMDDLFPKHIENLNGIFGHMTTDEKHQLLTLLKKLNHII